MFIMLNQASHAALDWALVYVNDISACDIHAYTPYYTAESTGFYHNILRSLQNMQKMFRF